MIYEGTTPIHIFTIPFDATLLNKVRILYSQHDKVIIVKTLDDCTVVDNTLEVKLTQEDTFAFDPRYNVDIQVRILTVGQDALRSNTMTTTVDRCLESEVLV